MFLGYTFLRCYTLWSISPQGPGRVRRPARSMGT